MKLKMEQTKNLDKATLILVGNPNVGKSAIFGFLTGQYVVVSNYPGTTVEITRGEVALSHVSYTVIDTPGVANLLPMSEDEKVTRDILMQEKDIVVLQVADAKNLERTLLLSLQISEMDVPFVLALNMYDEAQERRIEIDIKKLEEILGVPVVPTVAISRKGMDRLKKVLETPSKSSYKVKYDPFLEEAIKEVSDLLPPLNISKRSVSLMILGEDPSVFSHIVPSLSQEKIERIEEIIRELKGKYPDPLGFVINKERMDEARKITRQVAVFKKGKPSGIGYKIGNLCIHPIWGIPILFTVLLLMYLLVGQLAAGVVVDYLQSTLFEKYLIPAISHLIDKWFPYPLVKEALVGDYGIISMGITYAFAIVLPIVTAFFLFFGILEDSGYLPRLAIMLNNLFKKIGMNGKAVLPMVLGLGCGTMAAISARILDTKKERLMAILMISLGIPCSAQLGVIMGMLSEAGALALFIWFIIVVFSIFLVGYAANKVLPGKNSDFILEIPPLRVPALKPILVKTLARIEWYLREAVPLFVISAFALFLSHKIGLLDFVQNMAKPVVNYVLGLPVESTQSFIMGFLRRDYGAAGLMSMAKEGILNHNQMLVAMVTLTLFLPCIAQFFVIIKEKGLKVALYITGFILIYSITVGGLLNLGLKLVGISL